MGMGMTAREKIAKRAAEEIRPGMIVNLGIGIPSLIPNFLPHDHHVMFHAENGILGIGPAPPDGKEDAHLCNAGGFPVTVVNGASYFDSSIAFAMIRRGLIDLSILGGLEVSENGDLANWLVPGKKVPGFGGALELAEKAKKVIVLMTHVDKEGKAKIVKECKLPLTAANCVKMIITDRAVFQVKQGLILTEIFTPYTLRDIEVSTDCDFLISEGLRYR